jgi:hypothetical protein
MKIGVCSPTSFAATTLRDQLNHLCPNYRLFSSQMVTLGEAANRRIDTAIVFATYPNSDNIHMLYQEANLLLISQRARVATHYDFAFSPYYTYLELKEALAKIEQSPRITLL